MAFRCNIRFEKGGKKLGKRQIRTRVDCVKKHTLRHLRHVSEIDVLQTSYFIVNYLNHMLVGGASVNSLCQQGGPFALSVNRHSVIVYIKTRGRGRGRGRPGLWHVFVYNFTVNYMYFVWPT